MLGDELSALLVDGDHELARTLCTVAASAVEAAAWAPAVDALLDVARAHGCAGTLTAHLLCDEVVAAPTAHGTSSLFCARTPAVHAYCVLARTLTAEYLSPVLARARTALATTASTTAAVERVLCTDVFPAPARVPASLRSVYHRVYSAQVLQQGSQGLAEDALLFRGVGVLFFARLLAPALAADSADAAALVQGLAGAALPATATGAEAAFFVRLRAPATAFLAQIASAPTSDAEEPRTSSSANSIGVLRDFVAAHFDVLCETLTQRAARVDLSRLAAAVGVAAPLARVLPSSSSSQLQQSPLAPLQKQQQDQQQQPLEEMRKETLRMAGVLMARVRDADREAAAALARERGEVQRLDAENARLRAELRALVTRYRATPGPHAAHALGDDAAVPEGPRTAADEFWDAYAHALERADAIRARVAAQPAARDAVLVAQRVHTLHTLVQTPVAVVGAASTTTTTTGTATTTQATQAQLLPLRVATVRALDETLLGVDALARSAEPLFHLQAVDQRLADLSFALCRTLAQ